MLIYLPQFTQEVAESGSEPRESHVPVRLRVLIRRIRWPGLAFPHFCDCSGRSLF